MPEHGQPGDVRNATRYHDGMGEMKAMLHGIGGVSKALASDAHGYGCDFSEITHGMMSSRSFDWTIRLEKHLLITLRPTLLFNNLISSTCVSLSHQWQSLGSPAPAPI
jgi:hypothetical protein